MAVFGESWGYTSLLLFAALVRVLLVYYARIQDYLCDVKFTDIDYRVYTDAAKLAADGQSPFDRPTYRYTPVLAWLLQPNVVYPEFGKMLFVCADLWVGWLIYEIVKSRVARVIQDAEVVEKVSLRALCVWLFNPLTAVVCSRGNADVLVCAAVLTTLYLLLNAQSPTSGPGTWLTGAIVHGTLAVHLKLYPIIYVPGAFVYFLPAGTFHRGTQQSLPAYIWQLARAGLGNGRGIVYCGLTVGTAALSFYLCWLWCGDKFLQEALLYHFNRSDHRHNFSPYFYAFYLSAGDAFTTALLSRAAFVPQALLIVVFAIKYAPQNLPLAWLLTTMAFVAFNKVCTSQYFIWWLCLLPIVQADLSLPFYCRLPECDLPLIRLGLCWFGAQGIWLSQAYLLEFRGFDTFLTVWLSSLLLLAVHCYMMRTIGQRFELMKDGFRKLKVE